MNANPTIPQLTVRQALADSLYPLIKDLEESIYYGSLADVAFKAAKVKLGVNDIVSVYKMDINKLDKILETDFSTEDELYTALAKEVKSQVESWGASR